jgi:hypothetical protein
MFNRTYTLSPNPRGRRLWESTEEFCLLDKLLDTKCSEKLGPLLCFFYFPLCSFSDYIVFPCLDVCEEVEKECADEIEEILDSNDTSSELRTLLQEFNCSSLKFQSQESGPFESKHDTLVFKDSECISSSDIQPVPWISNSCEVNFTESEPSHEPDTHATPPRPVSTEPEKECSLCSGK